MKAEEFSSMKLEVEGWPIRVTTYRIGEICYAKVDNVSPGALIARSTGATDEEARNKVLEKARVRLAATRRQWQVST